MKLTPRTLIASICFVLPLAAAPLADASAELSGRVDLERLGVAFTVPEHWQGQLTDGAVVLGGLREPGLILL